MLVRLSRFQSGGNGAGRPAGFKPVGPVCKTGRRFDSIPRKGLVQLNNRRFLAPQAVKEIKERVRHVIKKTAALPLAIAKRSSLTGGPLGSRSLNTWIPLDSPAGRETGGC